MNETPSDFDELKSLLQGDKWPKAVPDKLICDVNSEDDKNLRADEILRSMITASLEGKKFLDFGCGQGHVVKRATQAALSVGYDIAETGAFEWEKQDQSLLTTSWDKVAALGPYDVVLIYDVLDHIVNEEPTSALKLVRSVVTEESKIYVRCHPWCGAHGGHLYSKINKAYAHLIFTENELAQMGYDPVPVRKVNRPQQTYNAWAKEAGFLGEIKFSIVTDAPSGFFKQTLATKKRIKAVLKANKWPHQQMRQSFVDFMLKVI